MIRRAALAATLTLGAMAATACGGGEPDPADQIADQLRAWMVRATPLLARVQWSARS